MKSSGSGKGANADKKISRMRSANMRATTTHSLGGQKKTGHHAPKPVTLATVRWPSEKDAG